MGIHRNADQLAAARIKSRGLLAFRDYLASYVASAGFIELASETRDRREALGKIRYCTRIRGSRVDVSRYQDEDDYSAEVLRTFDRFKQGAVDLVQAANFAELHVTWLGFPQSDGEPIDFEVEEYQG